MDGVEEKKLLHFLSAMVLKCYGAIVNLLSRKSSIFSLLLLISVNVSSAEPNCSLQNRSTIAPSHHSTIRVFVSLSMPEQSLKQYAIAAKKAGASLVLRGLVDNSMKKTVQRLQGLIQEINVTVLIDPTLYRLFKIDKVPAVVVLPPHEIRFTNDEMRAHDVIYGQTTLNYALQQIAEKGEAASTAQEALKRLRGSP